MRPTMFWREVRALDGSGRPALIAALAAAALLVAWCAWFFGARVAVYEVSHLARLEVEAAPHELDTPVGGRVVRNELLLGQVVEQGEILLEIDADLFRLEREAEQARLRTLEPQLAALRREVEETGRVLQGEGLVAAASTQEERARQRAAEAMARLKTEESAQLARLRESNVASALETQRTGAEAERHRAETEAHAAAVGRLGGEKGLRIAQRRAGIARLEQEIARLEGEREVAAARLRLYDQEVALRSIRAPVGGRVESVIDLRPGSVVEAGARLAVIVPDGTLRAVAFYEPEASVGRVRPGQRGRLRLHGFPWTKWGSLRAVVERVGSEPKDGTVRVELALHPEPGTRIPLQHGLPGAAEIEVERVSPASLVLDAAGRFLDGANRVALRTDAPARSLGP